MKLGLKKERSRTISESDNYLFGGLIGDANPFHFDEEFCKSTYFETRIVYGMLVGSYIAPLLASMSDELILYLSQNIEFLYPVKLGDTITVQCEVVEIVGDKVKIKTTVVNQNDRDVLTGHAWIKVMNEAALKKKERA